MQSINKKIKRTSFQGLWKGVRGCPLKGRMQNKPFFNSCCKHTSFLILGIFSLYFLFWQDMAELRPYFYVISGLKKVKIYGKLEKCEKLCKGIVQTDEHILY